MIRNLFTRNKEEHSEAIKPYRIYVPCDLEVSEFQKHLETYLQDNEKKEYRMDSEKNQLRINLNITKDLKKNKTHYTAYQIIQKEDHLFIHSKKITEDMNTSEQLTTDIDLLETKDKLVDSILNFANKWLDDGFFDLHQEVKMEFIAPVSSLEKNGLLAQLYKNEICLVCLGITNLKSDLFEVNKKSDYYLFITSQRNMIFETGNKSGIIADITHHHLELIEKIGKDSVISKLFSFDTEFFNDTLFSDIKALLNEESDKKIEGYADLLFNKYNTKEAHIGYIQKLYGYTVLEKDKLRNTLKSQLLHQFPKKECAKKLEVDPSFMNLMYTETAFGNTLYQALKDWNIKPIEKYNFLELLTTNIDNFKLKNIKAFYDAAITEIISLEKPPKNIRACRVKHICYLKETKQYDNAIPFYEYVLENLEDDSIIELISDTKTNVLNGEDCHPLRVQLLEELSEIKVTLNQSNAKELLELAQLQPLVLDRLTQLVTSGIFTEKANAVLALFMPDAFYSEKLKTDINISEKTYNKEDLFNLVVPDCFKDAKSFLDSFTSLIAQVSPPEYEQVTAFSEKLSETNHPEAFSVLQELMVQLQLEKLECYIGNGRFSRGIIGVEGSPNFLILGKDHLQLESPYYFTKNELKFNLALELTHILFEHTRITSKDVWRGAKSKGMDLAGVLLIALPMVSSIGSFAGKFMDMTKYTKLFTGVDKVANVVDKGQAAIGYGEKITEAFTTKQKESELLATSRLMEISADRVGLLLNNDLKSSISVLLKNNDDFEGALQKINEAGLYAYLLQQNGKGEFIHQELIIRIKSLCGFYLEQEAI